MTNIAVIYYSSTGTVHQVAQSVAAGAQEASAEVRLRRVAELAPDEAIDTNERWRAHADATADLPVATPGDLEWADGFAFGTPTRFGNCSAQLKQFIDQCGGLWEAGAMAEKVGTAFTSTYELHGGQESTLLSLYNVFHHWGTIIMPAGYVDYDVTHAAGGNPYGVSVVETDDVGRPAALVAANLLGSRLTKIAGAVRGAA